MNASSVAFDALGLTVRCLFAFPLFSLGPSSASMVSSHSSSLRSREHKSSSIVVQTPIDGTSHGRCHRPHRWQSHSRRQAQNASRRDAVAVTARRQICTNDETHLEDGSPSSLRALKSRSVEKIPFRWCVVRFLRILSRRRRRSLSRLSLRM